jgi:hypothetical protein
MTLEEFARRGQAAQAAVDALTDHEYFIVANSFAAPFVSDQSTAFRTARTPAGALLDFAATYRHPTGLYAAAAYRSADAYHKREPPLARWLSNQAKAMERRTESSFRHDGDEPGSLTIDGKSHAVDDPKAGAIVP